MAEKLVKIGEGEFSEVFLNTDKSNQTVLKRYKSGKEAEARREYLFLQSIKSSRVVKALDFRLNKTAELEIEYIRGKEISCDNINNKVILQCLITLLEIHSRGIIVNDIKPENILINNGEPYFIDFGLATVSNYRDSRFRGTPAYSAPEKFRHQTNTFQTDIFSLGMLFLHLLEKKNPATETTLNSYKKMVLNNTDWNNYLSEISNPIIKNMICYKPMDRSNLEELILQLSPNYKFNPELGKNLIFPSQQLAAENLLKRKKINLSYYDEPETIASLFSLISENEDKQTIILDENQFFSNPEIFLKNLNISHAAALYEQIETSSTRFVILHSSQRSHHSLFRKLSYLTNVYSINLSVDLPAISVNLQELKTATSFLEIPAKILKKWADNPPALIRQMFYSDSRPTDSQDLLTLLKLGKYGTPVALVEEIYENWVEKISNLLYTGKASLAGGFIKPLSDSSSILQPDILKKVKIASQKLDLPLYASYACFMLNEIKEAIMFFSDHLTNLVKQRFYLTALEICEESFATYSILKSDNTILKRYAFLLRKNSFPEDSLKVYDQLIKRVEGKQKAVILSDKAILESELNNNDAALHNMKDAANIFKQTNQYQRYARTLNNIGYTQYQIGDLGLATKTFREVHRYAAKHNLPNWIAVSLLNLSDLCLQQGQWQKAIHFGSQAAQTAVNQNREDYQIQAELIVCQARVIRGDQFEYADFIESTLNRNIINENQQLKIVAASALTAIYLLGNEKSQNLLNRIESLFPDTNEINKITDFEIINSLFWLKFSQKDYFSSVIASNQLHNDNVFQNILKRDFQSLKIQLQDMMVHDRIYQLTLIAALLSNNMLQGENREAILEFCDLSNATPPIITHNREQQGDLNFVWEIIQSILTGRDSSEVILETLKSLLKIGRMERAVYFKIIEEKPIASFAFSKTGSLDPDSISISNSVLLETINNRKLSFFTDLMDQTKGSATASIFGLGLRSAVCFPFIINGTVEGIFYSDASNEEQFNQTHRMYLQVIFTQSSSVLERLTLIDQLKLAETIQPTSNGFHGIIGSSRPMLDIFDKIRIVGKHNINVLINGETGTGKELIAKAIHQEYSPENPFIAINCSAIPEHLLESELFGYEKGAFTGADKAKKGLFEAAGDGTVFLDEIGEMPLNLQPKVLRVLQERMVTPLGSTKSKPVNMRVIAATNKELEDMVKQNLFRSDLLYRLSVFRLKLPSLNERQEDIPTLAKHFLDKFNHKFSKNIRGISPQLMQKIQQRIWPGNVRELENILEQAVVMSSHEILESDALPGEIVNEISSNPIPIKWDDFKVYRKNTIQKLDQQYLKMLLELVDGNYSAAARLAGISRIQLYRMRDSET